MAREDTPTTKSPASPLLAGVDLLLGTIEAQTKEQRAQGFGDVRRGGGQAAGDGASSEAGSSGSSLENLTYFMVRLNQIKDWLQQDQRLLSLVDDCIKQHVRGMERRTSIRNLVLAVVSTVAGTVLGWLFSALQSPPAVLQAIFNH